MIIYYWCICKVSNDTLGHCLHTVHEPVTYPYYYYSMIIQCSSTLSPTVAKLKLSRSIITVHCTLTFKLVRFAAAFALITEDRLSLRFRILGVGVGVVSRLQQLRTNLRFKELLYYSTIPYLALPYRINVLSRKTIASCLLSIAVFLT